MAFCDTGIASDGRTIVIAGPSGTLLQSGDLQAGLSLERCCFEDAGLYHLLLSGVSNGLYRVEYSSNLVDWTPRWTNQASGTPVPVFQSGLPGSHRFYRGRLIQ